jgi:hypothetical protein
MFIEFELSSEWPNSSKVDLHSQLTRHGLSLVCLGVLSNLALRKWSCLSLWKIRGLPIWMWWKSDFKNTFAFSQIHFLNSLSLYLLGECKTHRNCGSREANRGKNHSKVMEVKMKSLLEELSMAGKKAWSYWVFFLSWVLTRQVFPLCEFIQLTYMTAHFSIYTIEHNIDYTSIKCLH